MAFCGHFMACYSLIKPLHIMLALTSGTLFALRGLLRLYRVPWVNSTPLRVASVAVDTVLLATALTLVLMLPGALFANGWLTAKLAWLVVYIVLGSLALKRARNQRMQAACWIAALLAFAQMLAIARSHHPWGIGAYVLSS